MQRQVLPCYHNYLILVDVQLKDAIAFAFEKSLRISEKYNKEKAEDDSNVVVPDPEASRIEDCHHVKARVIPIDE